MSVEFERASNAATTSVGNKTDGGRHQSTSYVIAKSRVMLESLHSAIRVLPDPARSAEPDRRALYDLRLALLHGVTGYLALHNNRKGVRDANFAERLVGMDKATFRDWLNGVDGGNVETELA